MATTFILSTPDVNSYGFRILSEGIDLDGFRKNPVMFYNHDRWGMPLGRWENLRIENGNLVGDAVFDTEDERGKEIARKVDQGFLHAVSVGLEPTEMSEDPMYLLQGQTRPTVTRSELLEISIVDVPGNKNAVRLSLPQQGVTLSDSVPDSVLDRHIPKIQKMKNVALKLGLAENATEADVLARIETLQAQAAQSVPALLALGRARGLVSDTNVKQYEALARADFASTLALIEQAPAATPPAAAATETAEPESIGALIRELKLQRGTTPGDDRANWSYMDWAKKDPNGLEQLQREKPEAFQALVKALKN